MSDDTRVTEVREGFRKEFLDRLNIPFLKPIAEGFFENIWQAESLIQMPLLMFSMLEINDQLNEQYNKHVESLWRGIAVPGLPADLSDEAKTVFSNPVKHPDFFERVLKHQETVLAIPGCGEPLRSSMAVLYRAGISESWTAFECLATDLWVTSLNEEPMTLAQTAISSLEMQEPDQLTSKHVPVGLAARYGFDLRHCLGTLLKPKFDFTGVSGIQKAYRVFMPYDDFIQKVLGEPNLSELEATRHLVVHRAGRVDEEYRRRTALDVPVGAVLTFTMEQSLKFCWASANAGTGLLAFVNDWLAKKKAAA